MCTECVCVLFDWSQQPISSRFLGSLTRFSCFVFNSMPFPNLFGLPSVYFSEAKKCI